MRLPARTGSFTLEYAALPEGLMLPALRFEYSGNGAMASECLR